MNEVTVTVSDKTLKETVGQKKVDVLEQYFLQFPQQACPVINRFSPGLYSRECFLPRGTLLTSKIHKTEHQFIISKGDISVWTEDKGVIRMRAPHHGTTFPGTRRVLYAHEDTIWTTFHVTNKTVVDEIEKEIIEPREWSLTLTTKELQKCLGLL